MSDAMLIMAIGFALLAALLTVSMWPRHRRRSAVIAGRFVRVHMHDRRPFPAIVVRIEHGRVYADELDRVALMRRGQFKTTGRIYSVPIEQVTPI